jgi:predicted nuclease of predicted toxin-antitoxin system
MNLELLLDANLSWRSVSVLKNEFDDCSHVDNIDLKVPAKDWDIWDYAKAHGLVIVTYDEDFLNLSVIRGFPPKVVLLKTVNQSRKKTEELLIRAKAQIADFQNSKEYGVLEIVG